MSIFGMRKSKKTSNCATCPMRPQEIEMKCLCVPEDALNEWAKEIAEKINQTGVWLHKNDDYFDWYECSGCGYGSEGEVQYGEETRYCPNCGRRMGREE